MLLLGEPDYIQLYLKYYPILEKSLLITCEKEEEEQEEELCDIVSCSEITKTVSPELEKMTGLAAIPEIEHSQDTETNTIISLTQNGHKEEEDFILITASQVMT